MRALPESRLDSNHREQVYVSTGSTIRIKHNSYSAPSRLINSRVDVRICAKWIEVWVGQKRIERISRLIGKNHIRINYRRTIVILLPRRIGSIPPKTPKNRLSILKNDEPLKEVHERMIQVKLCHHTHFSSLLHARSKSTSSNFPLFIRSSRSDSDKSPAASATLVNSVSN